MLRTAPTPSALSLSALCASCPQPQAVAQILKPLGFVLTFSMPAQTATEVLAPLPAQYHFEDGAGNQVIYLAGRDFGSNGRGGQWLPEHASRWLAYVGAKPELLRRALRELTLRFWLD